MSLDGKGEALVAEAEALLKKGGGIMGMYVTRRVQLVV